MKTTEADIRDRAMQCPGALCIMAGIPLEERDAAAFISEFSNRGGRADVFGMWRSDTAVYEFKRDVAGEDAVAQALRYAGAIFSTRAHLGKAPLAIVVAAGFTQAARYAAAASGVRLFKHGGGRVA